jgi:hypothetical protein
MAQRMFEHVYPGLIDAVTKLGPGEFRPDWEGTRLIKDDKGKLCDVSFSLRYVFTDDPMLLRIRCSFMMQPNGKWRRYHYAHHCGPNPNDYKETHFRIDLDAKDGHHVHLPPFRPKHLGVEDVEPDVKNIDPFLFLKLVGEFRATKAPPLRRKT